MEVITHSKIDQSKMHYQKTYSEDLFGIPHAPEYQCKEIDKIVKAIKLCYKLSNRIDRHDEDDLRSALNEINDEMSGMDSDIEDIRTACEQIREWGQEWKELAKKVIENESVDIERYI